MACPSCNSDQVRTFSLFLNGVWTWWKGCNICNWEARDLEEESLHPEYYQRDETSPAKINDDDIEVKS